MKKKVTIIGAIVGVVLLGLLGYNLYEVHKENEAKEVFLEWLHDVDYGNIEYAKVHDARDVEEYYDGLEFDLTDEQRKEIVQLLKAVTAKDVVSGQGFPLDGKFLDIVIFTVEQHGGWFFRFDENVIYIHGQPTELIEITGRGWYWEIRNEKLIKFCKDIYDK